MGISLHDGRLTRRWVRSLDALTSEELTAAGGKAAGLASLIAVIVAREQGIPAVTGIDRITERLADGARIRVDGEAGTVVRLAGASPLGRGAVHDLQGR